MSYIRVSLSQNTQCKALHKLRARLIKNTMIRDGSNNKEDNIAMKVVKYQSLLSQKMLEQIKTEQLKQFQKEIRQYRESKLNGKVQKSEVSQASQGISAFLNGIKEQTKIKLVEAKRRSRTEQKSNDKMFIDAKQSKIVRRNPLNMEISLQNKGLNKNNESIVVKKANKQCLNLKGKLVQSQMVNLLSKIQEMNNYSGMNSKGHLLKVIEENYIEKDATQKLKYQSQRLNSAVDNQERVKFEPIGKRLDDKDRNRLYHSQQNLVPSHMPQISKKLSRVDCEQDQQNPLSSKISIKSKNSLYKYHKTKPSITLRQKKIQSVAGHSFELEGF